MHDYVHINILLIYNELRREIRTSHIKKVRSAEENWDGSVRSGLQSDGEAKP